MVAQSESHPLDAIIVGGGPAGANCALWLNLLGYHACIIEQRAQLGGLQNDSPYINQWMAVSSDLTGQAIAKEIHKNITHQQIPLYLNSKVTSLDLIEKGYRVHFINGAHTSYELFAPNLILATGVKPISAALKPSAHLLIGPGTQVNNYNFKNKKVAILGGGDNAFENYLLIYKNDPELIHIYARQDDKHNLKVRNEFKNKVSNQDVFIYEGALEIDEINLTINHKKYDVILVLYGWAPNLPKLSFDLKLDKKGFIKTHFKTAETSQPNVYAIGEIANRAHPCCVTAMADGVVAAKAIQYEIERGR